MKEITEVIAITSHNPPKFCMTIARLLVSHIFEIPNPNKRLTGDAKFRKVVKNPNVPASLDASCCWHITKSMAMNGVYVTPQVMSVAARSPNANQKSDMPSDTLTRLT